MFKNYIAVFSLILIPFFSFSQGFGVGYYDLKKGYESMDDEGKRLMSDCAAIMGVPIDSMSSCLEIKNIRDFHTNLLSSRVVVRTSQPILFPGRGGYTDVAVEIISGLCRTDKPYFMVFNSMNNGVQKVTLVMYY